MLGKCSGYLLAQVSRTSMVHLWDFMGFCATILVPTLEWHQKSWRASQLLPAAATPTHNTHYYRNCYQELSSAQKEHPKCKGAKRLLTLMYFIHRNMPFRDVYITDRLSLQKNSSHTRSCTGSQYNACVKLYTYRLLAHFIIKPRKTHLRPQSRFKIFVINWRLLPPCLFVPLHPKTSRIQSIF